MDRLYLDLSQGLASVPSVSRSISGGLSRGPKSCIIRENRLIAFLPSKIYPEKSKLAPVLFKRFHSSVFV